MNILLITPLYSSAHYDSGWFWLRALNELGHSVQVWDYRLDVGPPPFLHCPDVTLVLKGETVDPRKLPHPVINYWPDALERTPGIEGVLKHYDKVFSPVRPTPDWIEWLPIGWDSTIHRDLEVARHGVIYIGTNNSRYKEQMISKIAPDIIIGNGWDSVQIGPLDYKVPSISILPPKYLHEFVWWANKAEVLIDVHQSPYAGVNRKFFEMISCGFTIVDRVPGVMGILGEIFGLNVTYTSVEEAKELVNFFLKNPEERKKMWEMEKEKIQPYTYENSVRRLLECLKK